MAMQPRQKRRWTPRLKDIGQLAKGGMATIRRIKTRPLKSIVYAEERQTEPENFNISEIAGRLKYLQKRHGSQEFELPEDIKNQFSRELEKALFSKASYLKEGVDSWSGTESNEKKQEALENFSNNLRKRFGGKWKEQVKKDIDRVNSRYSKLYNDVNHICNKLDKLYEQNRLNTEDKNIYNFIFKLRHRLGNLVGEIELLKLMHERL